MPRKAITDPATFLALLEAGVEVYGASPSPLTNAHILWCWQEDSDWRYTCRTKWLPGKFYSVEVE